jgi:hypothetical protein
VLRGSEAPLGKSEILERSGLDEAEWSWVRARLREDPRLVVMGQRRGVSYGWSASASAANTEEPEDEGQGEEG